MRSVGLLIVVIRLLAQQKWINPYEQRSRPVDEPVNIPASLLHPSLANTSQLPLQDNL